MSKTTFIIAAFIVSTPFWPATGKSKKEPFWPETQFLSPEEWDQAPLQKKVRFRHTDGWGHDGSKTTRGRFLVTNTETNLYLLLIIYEDDFYKDKRNGEYADDRLWFMLDEHGGREYTNNDEDMISIFSSDYASAETSHSALRAGLADWYYENPEKEWEHSKEKTWEKEHIPNQLSAGGPDMKELHFFHSGDLIDGEVQDFAYEVKIPLNSKDPYDLNAELGDIVRIGIQYGNLHDGYATYPSDSGIFDPPRGFLRYRVEK